MFYGALPSHGVCPFVFRHQRERTIVYEQARLLVDCFAGDSTFANGVRDHGFVHDSDLGGHRKALSSLHLVHNYLAESPHQIERKST